MLEVIVFYEIMWLSSSSEFLICNKFILDFSLFFGYELWFVSKDAYVMWIFTVMLFGSEFKVFHSRFDFHFFSEYWVFWCHPFSWNQFCLSLLDVEGIFIINGCPVFFGKAIWNHCC